MALFQFKGKDLAIDLGTANSRVAIPDQGIVIDEPTVVAIDEKTNEPIAYGMEAERMDGKTPEGVFIVYPMEEGVIGDFDLTQEWLRALMAKADPGMHLIRPKVSLAVPTIITDVERRALEDACIQAGARETLLVEEPLAAAVGAGLPVDTPEGAMVLCLGAGTSEVAIVSMGGIVSARSSAVAGRFVDREIIRRIREQYMLTIGERTAERIKQVLGSCLSADLHREMEIHGRDARTGMPRSLLLEEEFVYDVLQPLLVALVDICMAALETTPPELARDILTNGMTITGGGARLRGIAQFLAESTGVPVHLAEDAENAVVRGLCTVLPKTDGKGKTDAS